MNVKLGDMAIIIKSCAGNEGKIGQVMEFIGDFEFCDDDQIRKNVWFVKFPRPIIDTIGGVWIMAPIQDAWLRPVSGLPDTEDTDTEQQIKETLSLVC